MPFYVVEPCSLKLGLACERSPLTAVVADNGAEEAIPVALREAAFQIISRNTSVLAEVSVPKGCDAAMLWAAGDDLLLGDTASIRLMLCRSGRRTLVPVHLNRKPGHEFDLVGLEPRIFTNLPAEDSVQSNIRIRSTASAHWSGYSKESSEHWVRILRALQAGVKNPEAGIDRLTRLWRKSAFLPPVYGALLVRNLIVLSIWIGQFRRVQPLLSAGMDRFPLYAELPFLAGWMALQQGRFSEAQRFAERAIENPSPEFVGSGGERSFRSAWLVARAAELQGNQGTAVTGYTAGIDAMPSFPPSVHSLLNQRVDRRTAELLSTVVLPGLARREPQYAGEILDFYVKHQKLEAAHRILELPQLAEETRASLEQRLREAHSALSPRRLQPGSRAGVVLTGPFWVHSSLARINRELGAVLAGADEIEAGFDQYGLAEVSGNLLSHFEAISQGMKRRLSRLDLTIRLHWPPNFDPPPCGKLISIVPWEFSAIPAAWVKPINDNVDELWVLSQFNRECFVRAGIPADRIRVIPPGIDANMFKQGGESWRPEGSRGFIFLFVGGAIPRKGVDVLWNAFQVAFSSADDVTLVIKEIGGESFYRGQSLTAQIRAMAASKPGGPHLVILNEELDDAKLAALYRGSDIFVLPYRGEGFGLPLAEALACGTPVITTGLGPAREFCPPEASWFIPARISEVETFQSTLGPASEPLTWFEPDVRELARIMRYVYERRLQNSTGTMQAPQKIRESLRWDRVSRIMLGRVLCLLGLEASCPPALLPGTKPSAVSSGINAI